MLGRGVDKAADLAAARIVLAARSQHDNGQCRISLGPLASGLRGHEIEAYVAAVLKVRIHLPPVEESGANLIPGSRLAPTARI